ncbi:MAG TPA: DUF6064 family protein [Thermoanaerobaculia bacterium]|nr:DUF6064 family protein [Thermoanaerobaculia bacterium]
MKLPFTRSQFLDVFAAYNGALWPAALLLWLVATLLAVRMLGRRPPGGRFVAGYLAVLWLWNSVAYHGVFFRKVNPAALGFAILFGVESLLLAGVAVFGRGLRSAAHAPRPLGERRSFAVNWRPAAGAAFLLAAVLYPFAAAAGGGRWPRLPTFGVPCPTVLFTTGVFLRGEAELREILSAAPLVWCVFGGSAAILLGMVPDYSLGLAGAAIVADIVGERRRKRRRRV